MWLVHIPGHPWVLGQATGTLDHETHHGPDSGEATTFPHIVFSATPHGDTPNDYIPSWSLEIVPKLSQLESRDFWSL